MTPTGSSLGWAPNACTLPTAQQPLRAAEFDTLFTTALRAVHRLGPGRVRLVLDGSAEASARDLGRRHVTPLDRVLQSRARAKLAEVEARITDLHTIQDTLRTALDAGCDDLTECAANPSCPLPFADLAASHDR